MSLGSTCESASIALQGFRREQLTSANQEALKVLGDKPARRRPTKASGEALGAVRSLDLDAKGAQHVDAPGSARLAVFLVARHGGGDFGVDEPMAALDIVVVAARANALDQEGLDLLDGGELAGLGC